MANRVVEDDPDRTNPRTGLAGRVWRGEAHLATVFWLYGFVAYAILRSLMPIITFETVSHGYDANGVAYRSISIGLFVVINSYAVFICVGIWRSAGRYMSAHPAKRWRAGLARICVVLGALVIATAIVNTGRSFVNPYAVTSAFELKAAIAGLNAKGPQPFGTDATIEQYDLDNKTVIAHVKLREPVDHHTDYIQAAQLRLGRNACYSHGLVELLKFGFTVKFLYSDRLERDFGSVTINPADCTF